MVWISTNGFSMRSEKKTSPIFTNRHFIKIWIMNVLALPFWSRDAHMMLNIHVDTLVKLSWSYRKIGGASDHIKESTVCCVSGNGMVEDEETWASETTKDICFTLACWITITVKRRPPKQARAVYENKDALGTGGACVERMAETTWPTCFFKALLLFDWVENRVKPHRSNTYSQS